ncbi:NAD-dependent aldehyde dehydrogenase [Dichomitus squalens]|nr:NAD-dependent aldehyde dehydrogenase [Dichomitus squalens]
MPCAYTPLEEIPKIRDTARRAFFSGKAQSLAFRKEQMVQVGYLLKDNEYRLKNAIKTDLGLYCVYCVRHAFAPAKRESHLCPLALELLQIRSAYDNLDKWSRSQNIELNINWFALGPKLKPEPKGVVLIIAPFNLPLFLTLSPLVSAIAAGNAVCIKPSEQNPTVNAVLTELLPKYLDPELYNVINGGIAETSKILEYKWDHTYKGRSRVGRIVATAAAKHLTPVTLEVRKTPIVLDPKIDIKLAARRLLWGRFANAGQICTCPDYLLVPREIMEPLVVAMKETYQTFYPDGPEASDSFARIVSEDATKRIQSLLGETRGTVILGGQVDVPKKYVAPTVVANFDGDDALMGEEIFGPVLMLVPVQDVDEAIAFIQAREYPLVVYVFSPNKKFQQKVFTSTKSGAALAKDTVMSPAVPGFPVGGVGGSGYGYYAARQAFEEFSHWRVTLDNPSWVDKFVLGFRFPPYQASPGALERCPGYKTYTSMLYASLPPRPKKAGPVQKMWAFSIIGAAVGAAFILLTLAWPHLQSRT